MSTLDEPDQVRGNPGATLLTPQVLALPAVSGPGPLLTLLATVVYDLLALVAPDPGEEGTGGCHMSAQVWPGRSHTEALRGTGMQWAYNSTTLGYQG